MLIDPEIEAIVKSYEVIKDLDSASKKRVITWLVHKFGLSGDASSLEAGQLGLAGSLDASMGGLPQEVVIPDELTGFDTAEGLYNQIATKTEPEKVLIVAAYLQEKLDLQELGGRRINTEREKHHRCDFFSDKERTRSDVAKQKRRFQSSSQKTVSCY